MAPALPLAKLAGVFVKQISKPVSAQFIKHAQNPGRLKDFCSWIGQGLHKVSTLTIRMSQNIDRFKTKYDVTSEDNMVIAKGSVCRIVRTEGERVQVKVTIDKVEMKTWIPRTIQDGDQTEKVLRRLDIVKLDPDVALDRGAVFLAEAIVLGTASAVVMEEYMRYLWNEEKRVEAKEKKRKEKQREQKEDAERRDLQLEEHGKIIVELTSRIAELEQKQIVASTKASAK